MDLTETPNPTLNLNDHADVGSAIDLMFLRSFVSGEQPFARSVHLDNVRDDAPLARSRAPDAALAHGSPDDAPLHRAGGWTLHTVRPGAATRPP